METPPRVFCQVGVTEIPGDEPGYFETAPRHQAVLIGRPPPEIRGYRRTVPEQSGMSWRVVCTLRGRQVEPVCEDIQFEVIERTFEEGMMRVMQLAMARISHDFADRLQGTAFQFVGRHDDQGAPAFGEQHPQFADHLGHVEYLLHHTQQQMDAARTRSEF